MIRLEYHHRYTPNVVVLLRYLKFDYLVVFNNTILDENIGSIVPKQILFARKMPILGS